MLRITGNIARKYLLSRIETWKHVPSPIVGRWNVSHNPKTISLKVYQANEDHCGCCQQTIPQPTNDRSDDYYKYFCS